MFHLSNMLVADTSVRLTAHQASEGSVPPLVPFKDGTYFKVLGDDIVFSDEHVSLNYRRMLVGCGVEISAHKSFEGKVAEFAGFIAVPTAKSVTVFRPYKVPSGDTITNPLDFIHGLGSSVAKLGPWWAKQFRAYAQTLGQRDISLTPFATDDQSIAISSFRCDNHWIISLSNRFSGSEIADDLPDLGGNTKINRSPLFRERGPMDLYGYNADALRQEDRQRTCIFRTIPKRLMQDPLIREWHSHERERTVKDGSPLGSTGKVEPTDVGIQRFPTTMAEWDQLISKRRSMDSHKSTPRSAQSHSRSKDRDR
jgi:hypothetical protein